MKTLGKTTMLIIALMMIGGLFTATCAAATLYVTSTADDGSEGTLRHALQNVASGDIIDITATGTVTLDPVRGPLLVSTSVTINGPGQDLLTISGGNAVPVLWTGIDAMDSVIPGIVVTVSGLTIADGFGDYYNAGGGIANFCTLMLADCTLTRNTSTFGGALASFGPAELANCTLSSNTASGLETDYMTGMGGAVLNLATMTLTDCVLTDNTAARAGGAIFSGFSSIDSPAVLTLTGCTLSGNAITDSGPDSSYLIGGGGAICNGGDGCTASLTIEDSILTGNSAWLGGAVVNYAYTDSDGEWSIGPPGTATASIVRSTLSNNVVLADGLEALGGAIAQLSMGDSASSASLTVDSSTLSGNSAASLTNSAAGGAIISLGGEDSIVSVRNSTLAGNSVSGPTGVGDAFGGAMALFGGVLAVDNSTLTGNFCSAQAGSPANGASGVANGWGEVAIKNTILANDAAGPNLAAIDTDAAIISYGYNLSTDDGNGYLIAMGDQINTDPMLGVLADNGGPTWTCALLPGSPAIDQADSTDSAGNLVTLDQRGVSRPQRSANDIGAFERQVLASVDDVETLIEYLDTLVANGVVLPANGQSLYAKLNSAIEDINSGDIAGAIDSMKAFCNQVRAFLKTGKLTQVQADEMLAAAQGIIEQLTL